MLRRLVACMSCCLLLAGVCGCSEARPKRGASDSAGSVAGPRSHHPGKASQSSGATDLGDEADQNFALPINAYGESLSDEATIQNADWIIVGRCLRHLGFSIKRVASAGAVRDALASVDVGNDGLYGNGRRYGLVSRTIASKYGYHLKSDVEPFPAVLSGPLPKHSAARLAALSGVDANDKPLPASSGVPIGGCQGEAERALDIQLNTGGSSGTKTVRPTGDDPIDLAIGHTSLVQSQTAPVVVAAIKAWSTCMTAQGFPAPDPYHLPHGVVSGGPRPSAREIRMAVADVGCKDKVHLVDIWKGWETRYQQKRIDENAEALAAIKKRNAARVEKAAAIIASY